MFRAFSPSLICLLLSLLLSGCPAPILPPARGITPPSDDASFAASELQARIPGAQVGFSKVTGEILWIRATTQPLLKSETTGPVQFWDHALERFRDFVEQNPDAFRIQSDQGALTSLPGDFVPASASRGGLSVLRVSQLEQGLVVKDHYALAFFNQRGELMAVVSRLKATQGLEFPRPPLLPKSTQPIAPARLPILPYPQTEVRWWQAPGESMFRKVREQVSGSEGSPRRYSLIDAETEETLSSWEETKSALVAPPTGWSTSPTITSVAPDWQGALTEIPSIQTPEALVLAYRVNFDTGAFGPFVSVGDNALQPTRTGGGKTPIATDQKSWNDEPAFQENLRDATHFAVNVEKTVRWFRTELGWNSWDGHGSRVNAMIRVRVSKLTQPELNAWGNDGFIWIGDGHTPAGRPVSDALDVVGHEFTHSVLGSIRRLEYHDESGALEESLADLFGESVAGYRSEIFGAEAGWDLRDLRSPETHGQPARYSDYQTFALEKDQGGVHHNSGILNRAVTRVISESGGAGFSPAVTARLLLDLYRDTPVHPTTRLEEFAAALSSHCHLREAQDSLEAGATGICDRLDESFRETELL